MSKLLSGRYLLTVIVGSIFAYLSITKYLSPEMVIDVIKLVAMFYFLKKETTQ